MIHYQLRCGSEHEFDGWFAGSAAFERQADAGLIACPVCAGTDVTRALMAPNLTRKGGAIAPPEDAPAPAPAVPAPMPPPAACQMASAPHSPACAPRWRNTAITWAPTSRRRPAASMKAKPRYAVFTAKAPTNRPRNSPKTALTSPASPGSLARTVKPVMVRVDTTPFATSFFRDCG